MRSGQSDCGGWTGRMCHPGHECGDEVREGGREIQLLRGVEQVLLEGAWRLFGALLHGGIRMEQYEERVTNNSIPLSHDVQSKEAM